MAKPKSPLLSLGAKGTIGDALTFQKRGKGTIARKKPIPYNPRSLPQIYHRWDFEDYAYLWTKLSDADKQVYRSKGARIHLTGFSCWMSEQLTDLTWMAGRWRLDETSGATVFDTSRNHNDGTIFGASPTTGRIDRAYSFDGLNDYINCGNDPSLQLAAPFSIELWVYQTSLCSSRGLHEGLIDKYDGGAKKGYRLFMRVTDTLEFTTWDGVNFSEPVAPFTFVNEWVYVVGTHDGIRARLYFKGLLVATGAINNGCEDANKDFRIGRVGGRWLEGKEDNVVLHSRCMDAAEILRKSLRRYP